jgi:hypothetical protein
MAVLNDFNHSFPPLIAEYHRKEKMPYPVFALALSLFSSNSITCHVNACTVVSFPAAVINADVIAEIPVEVPKGGGKMRVAF